MKICFNGWFSGFDDKTNPGLHIDFFLNLFEKKYMECLVKKVIILKVKYCVNLIC